MFFIFPIRLHAILDLIPQQSLHWSRHPRRKIHWDSRIRISGHWEGFIHSDKLLGSFQLGTNVPLDRPWHILMTSHQNRYIVSWQTCCTLLAHASVHMPWTKTYPNNLLWQNAWPCMPHTHIYIYTHIRAKEDKYVCQQKYMPVRTKTSKQYLSWILFLNSRKCACETQKTNLNRLFYRAHPKQLSTPRSSFHLDLQPS